MIRTWKVKGKGMYNGERIFSANYFISNNCVSCGWGEPALHINSDKINFETYKSKWIELFPEKNWKNQGIYHLFETLKKDDYIWTRLNGIYYVTQIPDDPKKLFKIDLSEDAIKYDSVVQVSSLKWIKVGSEASVPGSVSTFTNNRNSFYRVDNYETVVDNYTATSIFTSNILNNKTQKIEDKKMILNIIGPSSFEDVIALWLYDKFNYVVIPSTNKISTQLYEFQLVDGTKNSNNTYNPKKNIYIQAKNGSNNLYASNYLSLLESNNEVWLITSKGNIFDLDGNKYESGLLKITKESNEFFEIDELINFIFNQKNHYILPDFVIDSTKLF